MNYTRRERFRILRANEIRRPRQHEAENPLLNKLVAPARALGSGAFDVRYAPECAAKLDCVSQLGLGCVFLPIPLCRRVTGSIDA
jgi:hypothetical protein